MSNPQEQAQAHQLEQPLLEQEGVVDAEAAPAGADGSVITAFASSTAAAPASKTKRTARYVFYLGLFGVLLVVATILIYLAKTGAFKTVDRDVRIANGTVIEPNTKMVFPLHRATTLLGLPGPERIVGLLLKTKHVSQIHATLKVFVLGVYLDRTEARKVLLAYESRGCPKQAEQPEAFAQFVDLLSSAQVTVTFEYRMIMSPPGSTMYDAWLKDLVLLWESYGVDSQRMGELKQCFAGWYKTSKFKTNDVNLIQVTSKTKVTQATHNGNKLKPCKDALFGKAIITHELLENGQLLLDLLPTLWNKEYDMEGL